LTLEVVLPYLPHQKDVDNYFFWGYWIEKTKKTTVIRTLAEAERDHIT
jgi:hypothetical protein